MYDDMPYTMLHEIMKKKFNLEADDRINLSVKLPLFDNIMDITDNDEFKHMISKHYKKDSEAKIGNTFDNKEALDLAVRLKALEEGKDIQQDILSEYKINISYQQAWKGKDYGLQQIKGSPYESFEMIPYYCYNLERKNQGTVTRIKTDDKGVFEILFIALGASIHTFLNYLCTLLIIDEAHLKGEYKGTYLVAVGMDGNNQIVPVAFGICKGETSPCWSWWMSLKECIGDNTNLLFISDRHAAIALAVHNEFPLAFHFVYDWFKKEKYQGKYAESIHFIGDMQEWEFPSHIHPAIPPRMDNPEVDGASWTSWRLLFIIPSPNVTKLIGFTWDDRPIIEFDTGQHMLHPLQVYDCTSKEFHNVGIEADGGSFFIGPYKESLILLNV
uniref:Transposase, MuDR, MULE transposase domain protein n=1 Tax=Tanacetum cinerariifolium TaxID=118510 RepID=A0A6L2LNV5_TANCI|nr:transposase, MuDR, MULE transposase domain protein [Tanacetum cinerariifolium]